MRALILATCLALTGCGGLPPAPTPVTVLKVQYAFEQTYNTAGNAYLTAVKVGALTGERKAQAKALLTNAYTALRLAEAAQALGDEATTRLQSAIVTTLCTQVLELLK